MTEILTAAEFSSWYDENFDGMETNRKCILPILSGLIAKDKFPVLNRLIPKLLTVVGTSPKESTVRDKFRDSETYRLSYNTYISQIIDFLNSFAPENIDDSYDDRQQHPHMSFFGASFNPNKYFTKDVYGKLNSSRSAFDSYLSDNEEENTHVLNHVFELTYDSYVALVKHLNKPSRVSLNYPGGIR